MASIVSESGIKEADKITFTDIDLNPITVDNNPAHFDGFIYSISEFCQRTGKFLPLVTHGVVVRGHKTVVDSPAAVPFIQNRIANARLYDAENPCPPTSKRLSDHNAHMTALGSPVVTGSTTMPTSNPDIVQNEFVITAEDLEFGNAIALCFVGHADFVNRLRTEHGMGGRELIRQLKVLSLKADPAQVALVLRRFTKYAEAPVPINLDLSSFNSWYRKLQEQHRLLPRSNRKSDADLCQYINILFYSQPNWRMIFAVKMAGLPTASGNLTETLAAIRSMLEQSDTYAQLDAEQQSNTPALLATTHNQTLPGLRAAPTQATQAPSSSALAAPNFNSKSGTGEASSLKRAFAHLVAAGDMHAAYSVAVSAGMTRATADPKKNVPKGDSVGGGTELSSNGKWVPFPRDKNGKILKWVPGGQPCLCGGEHLRRDCPENDMWGKDANGKSVWLGGPGWVKGKPPTGFDRKTKKTLIATHAPSSSPSSAPPGCTAYQLDADSALAAELSAIYSKSHGNSSMGSGAKLHAAKVVSSDEDECPVCPPDPNVGTMDGNVLISPIDESALSSIEPRRHPPDISITFIERRLRFVLGAAACHVLGISARLKTAFNNNRYTLFCLAAIVAVIAMLITLFVLPAGPASLGMLHPAVELTPATPNHFANFVGHTTVRPPGYSASLWVLKWFAWVAASLLLFQPTWFWFVAYNLPCDIAQIAAYLIVAGPLSLSSAATYSRVLGLGGGRVHESSFFHKSVSSLNKIRNLGGVFGLIVLLAVLLSRLSPVSSPAPNSVLVAPPAINDVPGAPNVTGASLPFLGKWLPNKLDAEGAVIHSHDHSAFINESSVHPNSEIDTDGFEGCNSPVVLATEGANLSLLSSASTSGSAFKLASSLILDNATVDSGCSASCTYNCQLLVNTTPCDELFGAANGKLARATMIGNLPIVARAAGGQFVHFVLTNVRCVPAFSNFTLLSVDQMWEEQRIKSSFCDEKHLTLPKCSGGHVIPYDNKIGRNTLRFASAIQFYDKGILTQPTPRATTIQGSNVALGFHNVKSTAHIARLTGAQVGELFHRRWHRPTNVIRDAAHICADTTSNLSRAENVSCEFCAACNCKKASHGDSKTTTTPSSLPPCHSPGTLHVDLKGMMVRSIHGFQYALFAVDEYSRFIFVEYLKTKETREQIAALSRIISRYNSMVNVGCDVDGKPLPKPAVTIIRSDHEAALESKLFDSFRANLGIDSKMSPPYDHDLNPVAERAIGVISGLACSIRGHSNASVGVWPHIIEHAVNIHNSTSTSCGTSMADSSLSAHQRLTRTQPSVMDLATFGAMAVSLKSPPHRSKKDLSPRGWVGKYLGRSLGGKTGQWDVLADGKLATGSSVQIDEENFPWRSNPKLPLPPALNRTYGTNDTSPGGAEPSVASLSNRDSLKCLNLFSGPYSRAEGLSPRLKEQFGWAQVVDIDNDPDTSGGWNHDLLNDETFTKILYSVSNGDFDAIMVAFPCSTFSASRFFPTDPPGPPPIRTLGFPDGLPLSDIDEKHHKELRNTNKLLDRTCQIILAARKSPKRTSIILENPAPRNIRGTPQFDEDTADHGSLFDTTAFKELKAAIPDSSTATFAYCRLGSDYQKYTTLWYTIEAASILDQLDGPLYKCNHSKHPKIAGGRLSNGVWASKQAAIYPAQLNCRLAIALTYARTGDAKPISMQSLSDWNGSDPLKVPKQFDARDYSEYSQNDTIVAGTHASSRTPSVPSHSSDPPNRVPGSPMRAFPNLTDVTTGSPPPSEPPRVRCWGTLNPHVKDAMSGPRAYPRGQTTPPMSNSCLTSRLSAAAVPHNINL